MTSIPPRPDPDFSDLSSSDILRFLRLGLKETSRPIDALIGRLDEPDGHDWLNSVLASSAPTTWSAADDRIVSGTETLKQLAKMKSECKAVLRSSQNEDTVLAAMWVYYIVIAAALAHHDRLICSRSQSQVALVLSQLSTVAPMPWSELLKTAANAADHRQ